MLWWMSLVWFAVPVLLMLLVIGVGLSSKRTVFNLTKAHNRQ